MSWNYKSCYNYNHDVFDTGKLISANNLQIKINTNKLASKSTTKNIAKTKFGQAKISIYGLYKHVF